MRDGGIRWLRRRAFLKRKEIGLRALADPRFDMLVLMPDNAKSEVLRFLNEFLNPEVDPDSVVTYQKRRYALTKAEMACGLGPFVDLPAGAAMVPQLPKQIGADVEERIGALLERFRTGGLAVVPEVEAGVRKLVAEIEKSAAE